MDFYVRVEYDRKPIRHIAVQCPDCCNWFRGSDLTMNELLYHDDILKADFCCPICGKVFGAFDPIDSVKIKEVSYPDIYEGCLEKHVEWR